MQAPHRRLAVLTKVGDGGVGTAFVDSQHTLAREPNRHAQTLVCTGVKRHHVARLVVGGERLLRSGVALRDQPLRAQRGTGDAALPCQLFTDMLVDRLPQAAVLGVLSVRERRYREVLVGATCLAVDTYLAIDGLVRIDRLVR